VTAGGPQLERGHTRIANELLEQLAKHLTISGCQMGVMLMVIRFSYGYGRKHADFTLAELGRLLGMDRSNTRRAVMALQGKNMLAVTPRHGHKRQRFQIRKDWRRWV